MYGRERLPYLQGRRHRLLHPWQPRLHPRVREARRDRPLLRRDPGNHHEAAGRGERLSTNRDLRLPGGVLPRWLHPQRCLLFPHGEKSLSSTMHNTSNVCSLGSTEVFSQQQILLTKHGVIFTSQTLIYPNATLVTRNGFQITYIGRRLYVLCYSLQPLQTVRWLFNWFFGSVLWTAAQVILSSTGLSAAFNPEDSELMNPSTSSFVHMWLSKGRPSPDSS